VREVLTQIQAHSARPGEDSVQSSLVTDHQLMAALDDKWRENLQALEPSVTSVTALVKQTDALAGRITLNEAKRGDRCRGLATASTDGRVTPVTTPMCGRLFCTSGTAAPPRRP